MRLFKPRTKWKVEESAFTHYAPKIYNEVPLDMKEIDFGKKFKQTLMTYCSQRPMTWKRKY